MAQKVSLFDTVGNLLLIKIRRCLAFLCGNVKGSRATILLVDSMRDKQHKIHEDSSSMLSKAKSISQQTQELGVSDLSREIGSKQRGHTSMMGETKRGKIKRGETKRS